MSRHLELSRAMLEGHRLYPERLKGGYIDPDSPSTCPLGAAFLGSLRGEADVQKFLGLVRNSSRESLCEFIHHGLMKTFPQLGRSVRDYPALHKRLRHDLPGVMETGTDERRGFVAANGEKVQPYKAKLYRSLFGVITTLHDRYDWPKDRIAALLEGAGL